MPSCFREIKLKPNRRYAPVGRLAAETGWKYQDVIATLEAKRKAKAELYWENKQKKKALKATAAVGVRALRYKAHANSQDTPRAVHAQACTHTHTCVPR